MRHVRLTVPHETGGLVLRLAAEHDAYACNSARAAGPGGDLRCMVDVDLPCNRVGAFVRSVREEVGDARMVMFSAGTIRLKLPSRSPQAPWYWPVEPLSALELELAALQSVGSWRALILFAVLSGIIAAYGLIVGSGYLLVASMLVAPMGAPMMVGVIGAAIGDWRLVARGSGRFACATALVAAAGWATGAAYGLTVTTPMIDQVTSLSVLTGLVAVAAGLAGGLSAAQSEQSSFVSAGTAGFLIAAALAPPASVLGLGVVMDRPDVAAIAGFVLFYQFLAVLVAGAAGLRLHGIVPGSSGAGARGSTLCRAGVVGGATLLLALLTSWQVKHGPLFLQADVTQETTSMVQGLVDAQGGLQVVNVATRIFPGHRRVAGTGLLVEIRVRPAGDLAGARQVIPPLRDSVAVEVGRRWPGLVALVNITLITSPGWEARDADGTEPGRGRRGVRRGEVDGGETVAGVARRSARWALNAGRGDGARPPPAPALSGGIHVGTKRDRGRAGGPRRPRRRGVARRRSGGTARRGWRLPRGNLRPRGDGGRRAGRIGAGARHGGAAR